MGHHDFAVPIRFLALVGHFFAALLTVYAIRDNVIVALPYHYQQSELEDGLRSARAAIVVCVCVLFINSIGFLGGFSTFDLPASIFREAHKHTHMPCRRTEPRQPPAIARAHTAICCHTDAQISSHTRPAACSFASRSSTRATTTTYGTLWPSSVVRSCWSSVSASCPCACYGNEGFDAARWFSELRARCHMRCTLNRARAARARLRETGGTAWLSQISIITSLSMLPCVSVSVCACVTCN